MAEHYLNVLTVRLREYTGHPLPKNPTEEIALQVTVVSRVDIVAVSTSSGPGVLWRRTVGPLKSATASHADIRNGHAVPDNERTTCRAGSA